MEDYDKCKCLKKQGDHGGGDHGPVGDPHKIQFRSVVFRKRKITKA